MTESIREEKYDIAGRKFVKRYSGDSVTFFCDGAEVSCVEWNRLLNENQPMSLLEEHGNPIIRLKERHRRGAILRLAGDVAGKTVADIGCEEGHLSVRLAGRCKHLYCIDIDSGALARARTALDSAASRNVSFIACDAANIGLPDSSVDVCLASEVLEHLPRPEAGMAELVRITRPGGRIVISVPNEQLVLAMKRAARLAGLGGSLGSLSSGIAVGHLHAFTKDKLRALCEGRVRLDAIGLSVPFFLNIFAAGVPIKD